MRMNEKRSLGITGIISISLLELLLSEVAHTDARATEFGSSLKILVLELLKLFRILNQSK